MAKYTWDNYEIEAKHAKSKIEEGGSRAIIKKVRG